MKLDTPTIITISSVVVFVLVLMLLHTWRTRTTYPGFLVWTIGTACWSAGSLLNLMLPTMHPQFIPKIIGNGLIMLHPLLLYEGIVRFHGIRRRWWGTPLNTAVVMVGIFCILYFFYVSENIVARIIAINLVAAFILARISIEPLFYVSIRRYSMQWLLSAFLLPLIVLVFARAWYHIFAASLFVTFSGALSQDTIQRYIMFYGIIAELAIAYSYLSLTSDRVDRELRQSEERYRNLSSSLQEQIEAETRLRVAQERKLANHSRRAAMGEMISAIAHQWRQPLATLGIIIQRTHAVGTMQGLTTQNLDEFKQSAMRHVHYMSDTIEEFRDFYRPEKEKMPFSPLSCVSDSVRLFDPQFTENSIKVTLICHESDNKLVNGFPNELKQVILNLLGNARDAIVESRATGGEPIEGRISIRVSVSGTGDNIMRVDISDNGCGIPADIAAQIFAPYFTTKEESGGSGIGLYMCRMIVGDSLGGHLSLVENTTGTIFRIELPLAEQP